MAMFGGLVMTNNGRNLYAKAQTGKSLKVTKIVLGDGELGSSESMISMTALKNKILECSILNMKIMQNEIAKITFILTNKELLEGFTWRELGVIAEEPDTKEEILYCYGNARENGEYISPKGGADILEKHVSIDLVISNVENVSAVIDESLVFATKKEVEESISQTQQELRESIAKVEENVPVQIEQAQQELRVDFSEELSQVEEEMNTKFADIYTKVEVDESINQAVAELNEQDKLLEEDIKEMDNGINNRINSIAGGVIQQYGIGGQCKTVAGNLNTCCGTATGFYMGQNLTNAPTTGWYYIIHLVHNDLYQRQIIYELNGMVHKNRIMQNGAWSDWY